MQNPEIEGWENIDNNGGTIGAGINQAIHKLTIGIFNSGQKTSTKIDYLTEEIKILNKNLKKSDDSSTRLSKSLNKLTFFGSLVVLLGIIFQFIEFLYSNKIWLFNK